MSFEQENCYVEKQVSILLGLGLCWLKNLLENYVFYGVCYVYVCHGVYRTVCIVNYVCLCMCIDATRSIGMLCINFT